MATLNIQPGQNLNFTDVQDFFNIPRGGTTGYPTTGGVAIEDLGSVVASNRSTWPTGAAVVQGESDIVYAPGGGTALSSAGIAGELSHSRATPIDLTNARLDVEMEITSIDGDSGEVDPVLFVNGEGGFTFAVTPGDQTMTATLMLSDLTSAGTRSWPSTTPLSLYISESTSNNRPFTFTINHVRLSFTQTEFAPTTTTLGANLADYVRRGPIVPATSGGEATYPTTGGFAIENAGTFEARSTDSTNWAASADGVEVQGMPGIEYSIGGSGSFEGGGRFRNNTGNTITVQGNMRLRFTASNFRGDSTATIQPFFWNEESTFVQGTFTRPADPNGSVSGEIIINPTASQSTQWVQGGFLDFIYFDNQGDRPYDVTIDSLRVRFQGTEEFAPTGGPTEINTGIPETVNGLNLNQFYGVDDGED